MKTGNIALTQGHLIRMDHGVARDNMSQDGAPDIIVAIKKGVFIFERIKR
jgi:hypothetical protein